ncbi:DUF424 family protein [Candidatus Pacearchaeota archaeon]|nr:DUF424 family protein [Candidatus Pacearchaeota archaeon]
MFCTKIHKSYRKVVAICDSELIGKKFEDEKRQLDLRENFYKNIEINGVQLRKLIKVEIVEDATFNIVGKESVKIALEEGIIAKEGVSEISGIPFALKLL